MGDNIPALEAMLFLNDRHQCFVAGHQHAKVGAMTRNAQRKERATAFTGAAALSAGS